MNEIAWGIKIGFCSLGLWLGIVTCTDDSAKDLVRQIENKVTTASYKAIATENLEIKQYLLELKDLPLPYTTESASKSPKVQEIPANPTLKVPQGFKVNSRS